MTENQPIDVLVIGAGFAGAAAARELAWAGHRVAVVEASARVGGRALTAQRWGRSVDLGGQALTPMQPHVWAELTRYGLKTLDRPPVDDVWLRRSDGTIECWDPTDYAAMTSDGYTKLYGSALSFFSSGTPPWADPNLRSVDTRTIGDALRRSGLNGAQYDAVHSGVTVNFNAPPEGGAFTQGARRLALAMGQASLLSQVVRWRVVGGAQQIAERMLADAGCPVHLNREITSLAQSAEGVAASFSDGTSMNARTVVLTAPLHALERIAVSPPLPAEVSAFASEGQMSAGVMLWARVKGPARPFMAAAPGDNPLVFVMCDGEQDGSWFVQAFGPDRSAVNGNDPASVQAAIRRWFPEAIVEDTISHDWVADRTIGETWAMFKPGQLTSYLAHASGPHGRIVLASSDIATQWGGYFDGAIESGIAGARRLIPILEGQE